MQVRNLFGADTGRRQVKKVCFTIRSSRGETILNGRRPKGQRRGVNARSQSVQFAVDGNPDRLKSPRGGMNFSCMLHALRHRLRDQSRQFRRGFDRRSLPSSDDCPGDSRFLPFSSPYKPDHLFQFGRCETIDHIISAKLSSRPIRISSGADRPKLNPLCAASS